MNRWRFEDCGSSTSSDQLGPSIRKATYKERTSDSLKLSDIEVCFLHIEGNKCSTSNDTPEDGVNRGRSVIRPTLTHLLRIVARVHLARRTNRGT